MEDECFHAIFIKTIYKQVTSTHSIPPPPPLFAFNLVVLNFRSLFQVVTNFLFIFKVLNVISGKFKMVVF